jgi:hypothetical protein
LEAGAPITVPAIKALAIVGTVALANTVKVARNGRSFFINISMRYWLGINWVVMN